MTCRTSAVCNRPETPGQAASWQTRKNKYLVLGLCHACAAQAAYGHQLGFGLHEHARGNHVTLEGVHPPCAVCAPIVAEFPIPAARGWRKHPSATSEALGLGAGQGPSPGHGAEPGDREIPGPLAPEGSPVHPPPRTGCWIVRERRTF
jgi:hypothetical protein